MAVPPDPQVLAGIYRDAYLELIDRLASLTQAGRSTAFTRATLADIERILRNLDGQAAEWFATAVPQWYREGQAATIERFASLGIDITPAAFAGVHQEAIRVLAETALQDLTDATARVGRRVSDAIQRANLRAITGKVSRGDTVRETARALQRLLEEQGLSAAGGMRLDAYAQLVARSTTREATNLGRLNQQTEDGHDLVTIPPHTPTCPLCAPYQGRVYSVSGKDQRYPSLWGTAFGGGYANIHPNCKHVVVPYVERFARDAEADRRASNAAFEDNRPARERDAYAGGLARKRRQRETRVQWERYKARLGDRVPPLGSFASMKGRDSSGYRELMAAFRDAG